MGKEANRIARANRASNANDAVRFGHGILRAGPDEAWR